MPLIDSLDSTRLKSLRYSGIGPAVQKDINNPPVYNSLSHEAQARIDDVQRIGFAMSVGGSPFIPNQFALNAIDPGIKTQAPFQKDAADRPQKKGFGAFLASIGAGLLSAVEQFAGAALDGAAVSASTLAQAGVNGTGTHFVLGFGVGRKYLRRTNGHVLSKNGARVPIPKGFISELEHGLSSLTPKPGFNDHPLLDGNRLLDDNIINTPYSSVFDFIKSIDNRNDRKIYDFTDVEKNGEVKVPKEVKNEIKKETRLGLNQNLNSQGKVTRYTKNTNQLNNLADKINISEPQTGPNEDLEKSQMIKFFFEIVNPDNRGEEGSTENFSSANSFLYFRAYLDSLTDNYNGSWTEQRYLGRADNFYTYDGFNRQIQFAFKVAAESQSELRPIYNKLNYLASTTAPTYSGESGFMRGTLVNATIGDYIHTQPGFISDITYSWQTTYPFEIGHLSGLPQLPHILECSVSFTPIHRTLPTAESKGFINNKLANVSQQAIENEIDQDLEDQALADLEADIAEFDS